ncbi:MAG: 3'-5' exonuclease [Lachnospiraceae bacterium]|jgi:DNA polymerase-3 subunit epsilon|nr:3'-5' exonuclease [Lachnospiraceae bacterium]
MGSEYVALDLETTGLSPKEDRILEIGAAKVVDGRTVATYRVFVDSQIAIPEFVTQLTGIDRAMVKEGLPTGEAVEGLLAFCGDLPLLGHNIIFDYSFIKRQAVNMGLPFEKQGIDTLKISRRFLGELPSRTLEALCLHYHIECARSHRAMDDAVAASQLYEHMYREFHHLSPQAFVPKPLIYKVKKEGPITKSQKVYLNDLTKYHRIGLEMSIDSLTRNEASRIIDRIILNYGKIKR